MELWIWLGAIGVSVVILVLVLVWLASRGVILAKKLSPFADHLARLKKQAQQYPDAVKFYSDLAKTQETAGKKPRNSKG